MRRLALSLTPVLLLAACGQQAASMSAQAARAALPSVAQVQIAVPGGAAAAAQAPRALATGSTAPLAEDTIALAAAVNGGVAWVLLVVHAVVDNFEPTSCHRTSCTWGPGSGALDVNEYELTVGLEGDHFAWSLAGRPKGSSDPFTAFVTGHAWPTGVEFVGHGDLTVDLDAAQAHLAHLTDDPVRAGRIEVTNYDNRNDQATLEVLFRGTVDDRDSSQRDDAHYLFQSSAAGGDLQVIARNLTTLEQLALHSRWTAAGAGRGDAQYQGSATYTASQCWDAASTGFDLQYAVASPGSATGDPALCAYADAVLPTIQLPQ